MREQLNELANQLTELAAKYEEAVTPPPAEWNTREWTKLLERCYVNDPNWYLNLRGKSPIQAVDQLFMEVREAWSTIDNQRATITNLRTELESLRPNDGSIRFTTTTPLSPFTVNTMEDAFLAVEGDEDHPEQDEEDEDESAF